MVWRDAPDESLIFKEVCWFPQSRAYALILVILNFILPLIITSGIYFKIYLIAHQRKRTELVGDSLSFIEDNKTYLENMKDGKSIVMFIGVFFFGWLPYSTCIIFISLCNSCWAWIPEDEPFYFFFICGYLNSALNPILFAIWNRSFKATYSRLLSCHTQTIGRTERCQSSLKFQIYLIAMFIFSADTTRYCRIVKVKSIFKIRLTVKNY